MEDPSKVNLVRDTDDSSSSLPLVLSFNNLTYSVRDRWKMSITTFFKYGNNPTRSTKTILNDISGEAKDGEILGVLGDSGSGKSTLIDALAGRISKGSLKGSISLNGESPHPGLLKTISTYVMQDDVLFPMLTVEETLMYSAEFRLPHSLSKSKKKARVQALIDQLGLRTAAKTVIGDEGHRGVSGGEKRRVSIGIGIIHNPVVMFLDEPTSGLDSTSAFMVVKVLQRIAQNGSIVVMSIHQPSYRILGLLGGLIFLSQGHTVYNGSLANLPYFLDKFGHPLPENVSHTEFALDLIRELEQSTGGTKSLVEFNELWRHANNKDVNNLPRRKLISGASNQSTMSKFANPSWTEIIVLSRRSMLNSKRMPELFGIRLGSTLITGSILATVFKQLDNSPRGIQERFGFIAFAMTSIYFTCGATLAVFHQDRYIFLRETAYNTYRLSSYVVADILTSLPSTITLSFAFAATTFWAVGLAGGLPGFLFYFLIIFASFWGGTSFVTLFPALFTNVMVSFTVMVSLQAYFLLFCGFFINRDRIPPYWKWFHYISLVKYSYEGALHNEFNDPIKCFAKGIQVFDETSLASVPFTVKVSMMNTLNMTMDTCVMTGMDILKQQGVTDLSKWNCLWVTFAWGFLFRILFYFGLLFGSKNKRK
ncbi:ABC transporter G member 20 [Ranunculus cassubicifolius]